MKNGRPQAKDIDDRFFLRSVEQLKGEHWTTIWDLQVLMEQFPSAVVTAKAAALIRRGLLDGCVCGCRGDFELTDKGRAFLELH